ncbi:NnrU family protein, partial [Rhizobium ruizarguesonis]
HLLANGETSSVLLFAAFLACGVILRISLQRRQRAGEITLRPFVSAKYDLYAIVMGIVVWALISWKLNEWLSGVSPLVM